MPVHSRRSKDILMFQVLMNTWCLKQPQCVVSCLCLLVVINVYFSEKLNLLSQIKQTGPLWSKLSYSPCNFPEVVVMCIFIVESLLVMQEKKSQYLSVFKHQKYQYLYVYSYSKDRLPFRGCGCKQKRLVHHYFEKHSFFNF